MPIIKSKEKIEKEQIRINIEKTVMEKIREYCNFANVSKPDDFFQQAAEYLLSKDKDWKKYINQKAIA